jgi:hypothetical protein
LGNGVAKNLQYSANKEIDNIPHLCKGFSHSERGDPLPMIGGLGAIVPVPLSQGICHEGFANLMIE